MRTRLQALPATLVRRLALELLADMRRLAGRTNALQREISVRGPAAATANSTPPSTASRLSSNATTRPPKPSSPARSPKAGRLAKHAAPSNATSPTSPTAAYSHGPRPVRP